MLGYIKLVFWANRINFGDIVSPYLIGKLSGKRIIHKNFYEGRDHAMEVFWDSLKSFNIHDLINNLLPYEENLVAVGSILARGNSKSKIWGAGFIDNNDPFYGGKTYAVRGKYSAEKLVRMGFNNCLIYGDPAILLPIVYNPPVMKEHAIGIVAHINDVDDLKNLYGERVKVISLANANVESVIDEILSCSFVYSTSLHGLIVSHAYGIPAVRVTYNKIVGNGIKFKDYFSSVDIPFYEGYSFNDIDLSNQNVSVLIHKYSTCCLPHKDVKEIRKSLLNVAPFKVLDDYLQVLN